MFRGLQRSFKMRFFRNAGGVLGSLLKLFHQQLATPSMQVSRCYEEFLLVSQASCEIDTFLFTSFQSLLLCRGTSAFTERIATLGLPQNFAHPTLPCVVNKNREVICWPGHSPENCCDFSVAQGSAGDFPGGFLSCVFPAFLAARAAKKNWQLAMIKSQTIYVMNRRPQELGKLWGRLWHMDEPHACQTRPAETRPYGILVLLVFQCCRGVAPEKKTAYTTTTERKSFRKLCGLKEKHSRPVVDTKSPINIRKTISTTEIFSLWPPFLGKESSSPEQGSVCFFSSPSALHRR